MESFWNDLHYEDIHVRDNLQFELESDYAPIPNAPHNVSSQEFYFFIPAALQINPQTYSKEQFYKDRTNLIRYKTPEFTFKELLDKSNIQSPMSRLQSLCSASQTASNVMTMQDELKLLGNVARSALRVSVRGLIHFLDTPVRVSARERLEAASKIFCQEVTEFREAFSKLHVEFLAHWSGEPMQTFAYVDEFISSSIDYYMIGFLEYLRASKMENTHPIDQQFCEIILKEQLHRQKYYQEPKIPTNAATEEKILYRKGLLNKYVLDALLLVLERKSWVEKYGNLTAGLSAGIAMLVYVLLVFLNFPNVGFNSLPFLLFTVVIYVLKDRIKDSLKVLFQKRAVEWFSDYTTQVKSPNGERYFGRLKEFFSFVSVDGLPDDIVHVRGTQFDSELPLFKRPETVFYYKKEMELGSDEQLVRSRRHKLHNTFLFNIHLLLEKASNHQEMCLSLDADTVEICEVRLPKVYHVNIVMKNSYLMPNLQKRVDIKRFRIVLDKMGIKRVELVSNNG